MLQSETPIRGETPARWEKAAERAEIEGIRVCQLQGSGQWIATGGSQSGMAYEVAVTGNVAHGCDCLAGMNGDPVCKHRAAFYLLIGALVVPEPEPPAPALVVDCAECHGCGVLFDRQLERRGLLYPTCPTCGGAGVVDAPARQPAA
jgi:hypothetical protein